MPSQVERRGRSTMSPVSNFLVNFLLRVSGVILLVHPGYPTVQSLFLHEPAILLWDTVTISLRVLLLG
jgi:hypothetical protein